MRENEVGVPMEMNVEITNESACPDFFSGSSPTYAKRFGGQAATHPSSMKCCQAHEPGSPINYCIFSME